MRIVYVPVNQDLEVKQPKISGKAGLVWTEQYEHLINNFKGVKGGRVLGCDVSNALRIKNEVDYYLFIGDGKFHPLMIAIKTQKPVYLLNGEVIGKKDVEEFNKKKWVQISKARKAKKFGILVSIKQGQCNFNHGLDGYTFVCDTLNYNELLNYPDIDCWVNTMCPRIGIDEIDKFEKPIINLEDTKWLK